MCHYLITVACNKLIFNHYEAQHISCHPTGFNPLQTVTMCFDSCQASAAKPVLPEPGFARRCSVLASDVSRIHPLCSLIQPVVFVGGCGRIGSVSSNGV